MGRRDDDTVRPTSLSSAVVRQNGVRDNWRWGNAIVLLDDGLNIVRGENFQRRTLRRRGQGVRVLPHVQGARSTLRLAVIADRLGNGENVRFGECPV